MPIKPHIRMTAIGSLAGGEIFNFGIAIAQKNVAIDNPFLFVADFEPNAAVWSDLRDDLVTYWNALPIHSSARLLRVKFASMVADAQGDAVYAGPPVERACGGTSGVAGSTPTNQPPNQVALAVTTHTAGDLGRVKGRYYLPVPAITAQADGRLATMFTDEIEAASQTFLNAVNNQPGWDILDMVAVVASAGRHNSDGSVKIPGKNHEITGVSVGRVLDVQRRRRNKLREERGVPSPVS